MNRNERREKVRKVVRRLHFSFSDLSLELSGVQHIKPETKDTQNLPIHLKDPFDHSDHSPPLTHPQTFLIPPKHSFQAWFPVYPPCVAFRGGGAIPPLSLPSHSNVPSLDLEGKEINQIPLLL